MHHSQSGFVQGRNITDGLRVILDVIEDSDRKGKDGLLMTVDFEKAFDSISWDFLFKSLKCFNFGPEFIRWVQICYTDISSCIINYKSTSQYFNVQKGVRQGDPLSPYLFILAVELLAIQIRDDDNINGYKVENRHIKALLYADDMTLFIRNEAEAKKVFSILNHFELVSGLKVNKSKSEGMWLGKSKSSDKKPLGIRWPEYIKILGIYICHDNVKMLDKNFEEKLSKIRQKLCIWKQRDLSIYRKCLILKTFVFSQLLYVSSCLSVPDSVIDQVESLAYNFLWGSNQQKVKKRVVIQYYDVKCQT